MAKVFLALPVDARLRCIEMCRAWRAFLADASLWEHLNLSIGFFSQNLLFAALLKAGAQLMTLDLTQRHVEDDERFENILRAARNLQKLRMAGSSLCKVIESVRARLRAHPRLQVFETGVSAVRDLLEARRMLNCDSPYKPLRIRMLSVAVDSLENDAEKDAFLGEVQSHVCLQKIIFGGPGLNTVAFMNKLVDVAVALRLLALRLSNCYCTPDTTPTLTKLITAGWLRELELENITEEVQLFDDDENARLFAKAVCALSLTKLLLRKVGLLPAHVVQAALVANARG